MSKSRIRVLSFIIIVLISPIALGGCSSTPSAQNNQPIQKTPAIKEVNENVIKISLKKPAEITYQAEKKALTIASVKLQKEKLLNQTVTLIGQYLGWAAGAGAPPVTRSDWVLKDATGTIYVTGKLPLLDPLTDKGKKIEVTGTVLMTSQGQVYLKSQRILSSKTDSQ